MTSGGFVLLIFILAMMTGLIVFLLRLQNPKKTDLGDRVYDCINPTQELAENLDIDFEMDDRTMVLCVNQATTNVPWPEFINGDKDDYSGKLFLADLHGAGQVKLVTGERLLEEMIVYYPQLEKIWQEKFWSDNMIFTPG